MIRRDPSLSDNKILPAVLAQRLGDTIYARLRFGFEDQDFGAPDPCRSSDLDCVAEGMTQIVDALLSKGYALRGNVNVVGGGGGSGSGGGDGGGGGADNSGVAEGAGSGKSSRKVSVKLAGPASLWGAQALAAKGVNPPNEYVGYCLTAFCRASGVKSSYTVKVSDTSVDLDFTISRL